MSPSVPSVRHRVLNDSAIRPDGDYVLYWMIMNRRASHNFSLDRAVEICRELDKPLLVFEALRIGYQWASDRIHRFVLQGMAENRKRFAQTPAHYYAYVEPSADAGKGLLAALADRACAVVTDDFPCFFIPRMLTAVAPRFSVRLEAVDSNGLFPMRATDRVFSRAHDFRRFLQKEIASHIDVVPRADPWKGSSLPNFTKLPAAISKKWPEVTDTCLQADRASLAELDIDHSVVAAVMDGGTAQAEQRLERFVEDRLIRYGEDRSRPDVDVTSGLSPYLHFGHLSVHQVFERLRELEGWHSDEIQGRKATGKREGWWQMSPPTESFLDEIITWREVGYNMCCHRPDFDQYASLPEWAQKTLQEHARDKRAHLYSLEEFESAATHDELWNAAQHQ
ncbi:MAG: deoxyribodipyrimidine photolyase, partial [Planctomycetota bacterium]